MNPFYKDLGRQLATINKQINKLKARPTPVFTPFDDTAILAELASQQTEINALQVLAASLQDQIDKIDIIIGGGGSGGGGTGGVIFGIRTISASATLAADDYTVKCDASSGAIVATLTTSNSGHFMNIVKIDSSVNTVTLTPSSGLINGAASQIITNQWTSRQVQSDGTNWVIL